MLELAHHLPRSFCRVTLALCLGGLTGLGGYESIDSASMVFAEERSLAEELPRLPAVEAKDALKTFHVERGFELELVAAEPMVGDPVDACFDENGRMFVAEFHAYPYALEKDQIIPAGKGRTDTGIIRMLEDTNGDGVMDQSTIFADKMDWPLSVVPYNGGVFVIDPPEVYYLKDTDGDGKADVREVVYSHLGRNNVQGLANNMKWGLDNRIWVASGSNGGQIWRRGKEVMPLGRSDWSFDPKTEEVQRASGGIQFGHSMDDWGNRFLCSNSVHIMHVVFENKYLERNPFYTVPGTVRSIGREGGAAQVFRRSPLEPWRIVRTRRRNADPKYAHLPETEKHAGGFFTSAAGVTIYRGSAYPEEFQGNAFVGDVGSNLVHRKTMHPRGATFEAVRADQNTEFVASTDTWFRPVNYVNAPDGTLYILDMYRETIEHPISIPPDIKAHLDLESGNDRGRIYRLVSPGMKRIQPPQLGKVDLPELVENLASPNSWNRETAQRLLWERQDQAAVPLVIKLLQSTESPLGRLHALYTLQGLKALTPELIAASLKDSHPGVRRHAIELSENELAKRPELAKQVLALLNDADFRVQLQAVLALSWMTEADALAGLRQAALKTGTDSDLDSAFMLSVGERGPVLIGELLQDKEFLKVKTSAGLLMKITTLVGTRPENAAAESLLKSLMSETVAKPLQQRLLQALGQGLARRGSSIPKLMASLPATNQTRTSLEALFNQGVEVAADDKSTLSNRVQAVQILASAPWSVSASAFEEILLPHVPHQLQVAALTALTNVDDPGVPALLVQAWRGFTPAVRTQAADILMARATYTSQLLNAVAEGKIKRSDLDRTRITQLLAHPQKAIKTQAEKLLSGDAGSSRLQVVTDHQPVLDLMGNIAEGQKVFTQKCATCHKLGEVGFQVGPDLTSVQNKSPADLLIAILDPNREAQLNFTTYTVATTDGRIFTGMISAESPVSLTLKRAEAKEDIVLRDQIDSLISSGLSLMPEGMEKEINQQQIADLIAFIKSLKAPAPTESK